MWCLALPRGQLKSIWYFTFIPVSLPQHWLEFTKSIAKQMKCKYIRPSVAFWSSSWSLHWCLSIHCIHKSVQRLIIGWKMYWNNHLLESICLEISSSSYVSVIQHNIIGYKLQNSIVKSAGPDCAYQCCSMTRLCHSLILHNETFPRHFLNVLFWFPAAQPPFTMCLRVKFYPPEPAALKEEITRYDLPTGWWGVRHPRQKLCCTWTVKREQLPSADKSIKSVLARPLCCCFF